MCGNEGHGGNRRRDPTVQRTGSTGLRAGPAKGATALAQIQLREAAIAADDHSLRAAAKTIAATGAQLGEGIVRPQRPRWTQGGRTPPTKQASPAQINHPSIVGQDMAMKVFGIAGRSGMGKTTLLERLVATYVARGLRISLIKHSHKDIEVDRPGKDSYRLREAGCQEVLLMGKGRWALMHELRGDAEPPLDYLLSRLQPCDLALVEGFKAGEFPKLEVWRRAVAAPLLWPQWPGIMAIASDEPAPPGHQGCPWFELSDTALLADFIWAHAAAMPVKA
jgi:molybdopterin-guanine dinucleotide biosynthesis protein B